jgi:uncharacterized protein (TIGR03437 family)
MNFLAAQLPSSVPLTSGLGQSVFYIPRVNGTAGSAFLGSAFGFFPGIFAAGYDCYAGTSFIFVGNVGIDCGLAPVAANPYQVQRGTITDLSGNVIWSGNPLRVGPYYSIWLTGLGFTGTDKPPRTISVSFTVPDQNRSYSSVVVPGSVAYVGEAPQYPGLYQLNFQLPAAVTAPNGFSWACGNYKQEIRMDVAEGGVSSAWMPVVAPACKP